MMFTHTLLLMALSFLGLANAYLVHVQHKRYKKEGKEMFCLFKEDCLGVVDSKYGYTFGTKNEVWGIFFYLTIFIYSLFEIALYTPDFFKSAAFILIFMAALFSIYLLFVQFFLLKKTCSWCLIAISINFLLLATFFLN